MQKEKQQFQDTLKPYIQKREALKGYQEELAKLEKELITLEDKELNFKDSKRRNDIKAYITELKSTINQLDRTLKTTNFNPVDVNQAYIAMQSALVNEDKEFTNLRDEYRALFVTFVDMSIAYQQAVNTRNQQTYNTAEELGLSEALGDNKHNVYESSHIHNSLAMSNNTLTELKQLANKAKKILAEK
ncbi:hypothetical protein [Aerococcus sp. HMSC10H05]|uniref:hypothetical protein n=1 Tax=Aerococcus sp. HMSC10H05 TaxID=1581084 RepID=UPI0008A14FF3|nr:hypothetical protein [Aerococcus sp. HMSC10H05]OFU49899.1 hypothetical protein HMPREF3116_06695 [Aerococcus sp. HMSC10H05]